MTQDNMLANGPAKMWALWRVESCDGRGDMKLLGVTNDRTVVNEFLRRCVQGHPYVGGEAHGIGMLTMEDLPA